jgi:hypothetical protein
VWLDLKNNTAKYYFGEKPDFCVPSKNFVVTQEKFKSSAKTLLSMFSWRGQVCFTSSP